MGNITTYRQDTCKICMKCNNSNILNRDLLILRIELRESLNRKELLLSCSKGHIFKYEGNTEHIDYCVRVINEYNSGSSIVDKLKKDIYLLQDEITTLKKIIEPSAPPLIHIGLVEDIELVKAEVIPYSYV